MIARKVLKIKGNVILWLPLFIFSQVFSSVITNQTIVINNMSDYKVIVEERSASKMKVTTPSEIDSGSYGEINVRIEPGFWYKNPPDATMKIQFRIDGDRFSIASRWRSTINYDELTPTESGYYIDYDVLQKVSKHVTFESSLGLSSGEYFSKDPLIILITNQDKGALN